MRLKTNCDFTHSTYRFDENVVKHAEFGCYSINIDKDLIYKKTGVLLLS